MTASPPADPAVRAFCDSLAEAVARQVLAEIATAAGVLENAPAVVRTSSDEASTGA